MQRSHITVCLVFFVILPSLTQGFFVTDYSCFFVADVTVASPPLATLVLNNEHHDGAKSEVPYMTIENKGDCSDCMPHDDRKQQQQQQYQDSFQAFAATAFFLSSKLLQGMVTSLGRLNHKRRNHKMLSTQQQSAHPLPSTQQVQPVFVNRNLIGIRLQKLRKKIKKNSKAFYASRLSFHAVSGKLQSARPFQRNMLASNSWPSKIGVPLQRRMGPPRFKQLHVRHAVWDRRCT